MCVRVHLFIRASVVYEHICAFMNICVCVYVTARVYVYGSASAQLHQYIIFFLLQ